MSAERGVAVWSAWHVSTKERIFRPFASSDAEPYTAFPESYAAALVDVAEAARVARRTAGRTNWGLLNLAEALDRLDAAKATP